MYMEDVEVEGYWVIFVMFMVDGVFFVLVIDIFKVL